MRKIFVMSVIGIILIIFSNFVIAKNITIEVHENFGIQTDIGVSKQTKQIDEFNFDWLLTIIFTIFFVVWSYLLIQILDKKITKPKIIIFIILSTILLLSMTYLAINMHIVKNIIIQ